MIQLEKSQFEEPWCETISVLDRSQKIDKLIPENLHNSFWEKANDLFTKGYTCLDLKLKKEFTDRLKNNLENFITSGKAKKNPKFYHYNEHPRIVEAWKSIKEVKDLANNKLILSFLRFCYKKEPLPFSTINFKKGTEQPLHSDYIHFGSIPEKFLAASWTALEDIDVNQGPLQIAVASHKLPIIDFPTLNLKIPKTNKEIKTNYERYEKFLKRLIKINGLVVKDLLIKRGESIIWLANSLHGGARVLDVSKTRYSQVTHYHFEGCKYYNPNFSDRYKGNIVFREISEHIIK